MRSGPGPGQRWQADADPARVAHAGVRGMFPFEFQLLLLESHCDTTARTVCRCWLYVPCG